MNLPAGVTLDSSNQTSATNTQIQLSAVNVAATTPVGPNNITVTANGMTSAPAPFTIDGPDHMVVQNDVLGHCSGCTTTVSRIVTFQVIKFSGNPVFVIPIGEVTSRSGWTCTQSEPGIITTPCSSGYDTTTSGTFEDEWDLGSDGFTPAGCGWNFTTHWQWCAAPRTFGTLAGYTHNNAISENNVVNPPNTFAVGTVIAGSAGHTSAIRNGIPAQRTR